MQSASVQSVTIFCPGGVAGLIVENDEYLITLHIQTKVFEFCKTALPATIFELFGLRKRPLHEASYLVQGAELEKQGAAERLR